MTGGIIGVVVFLGGGILWARAVCTFEPGVLIGGFVMMSVGAGIFIGSLL
jgi:hypothetical protein